MFLARRPSAAAINRFLAESRELPLSYGPVGIVRERPRDRRFDEQVVAIGKGTGDFDRAREALMSWKQFDIGWVQTFPRDARIETGTVVAVLIRHLGFWSLNGARVVYIEDRRDEPRFAFGYGTLPNHAEGGEELFEVFVDPPSLDVMYRIRATSWPQTRLASIGQPIVRVLQARFRRDSAQAMRRTARGLPRLP
ncbi:MAG: DUF1990 domain-containing protein [Vicinamibacterales bacterium]